MSAVKLVLLRCDKPSCTASVQTPCDSTFEGRPWAKGQGWTAPNRFTDLCPAHSEAAATE